MTLQAGLHYDWHANLALELQKESAKRDQEVALLREKAFQRIEQHGFPTTKDENWRYTNLREVLSTNYQVPVRASTSDEEWTGQKVAKSLECVLIDGVVVSLPDVDRASGVKIWSLSDQQGSSLGPDLPHEWVEQYNPIVDLNTSLVVDELSIEIDKKADLQKPIEIQHRMTSEATISCPRVRIHVKAGASATLIERLDGSGTNSLSTRACQIVLEEGARLEHIVWIEVPQTSSVLSHTFVSQEGSSHYHNVVLAIDGKTVRNEIYADLNGKQINTELYGLSVLRGDQHADHFTRLRHAEPESESLELYKGIYDDQSSGAFSGTIIVEKDAQKTNAIQNNQALLLSENASIRTRPQLKIWADDVKCTHGATVGQLDEEALFYIRSRGVSFREARNLLLQAFAGEVTSQIGVPEIRDLAEQKLVEKLGLEA